MPNYNALDFDKVNIKAALNSQSSIKSAKEASRLIRINQKRAKSKTQKVLEKLIGDSQES